MYSFSKFYSIFKRVSKTSKRAENRKLQRLSIDTRPYMQKLMKRQRKDIFTKKGSLTGVFL